MFKLDPKVYNIIWSTDLNIVLLAPSSTTVPRNSAHSVVHSRPQRSTY